MAHGESMEHGHHKKERIIPLWLKQFVGVGALSAAVLAGLVATAGLSLPAYIVAAQGAMGGSLFMLGKAAGQGGSASHGHGGSHGGGHRSP